DTDRAARCLLKAIHQAKQRRLTFDGIADDGVDLARSDIYRQIVDSDHLGTASASRRVAFANGFQFNSGHNRSSLALGSAVGILGISKNLSELTLWGLQRNRAIPNVRLQCFLHSLIVLVDLDELE